MTRSTLVTYRVILDGHTGTVMYVDFHTRRDKVTDYAVVLTVQIEGVTHIVRLYDGAHGFNELHRYTRLGKKQPGEAFHAGTLGEGMRWAIDQVARRFQQMIETRKDRA